MPVQESDVHLGMVLHAGKESFYCGYDWLVVSDLEKPAEATGWGWRVYLLSKLGTPGAPEARLSFIKKPTIHKYHRKA